VTLTKIKLFTLSLLAAWCIFGASAEAKQLTANAAVQENSVYVGEAFIFQVQVSGSDHPEQPNLFGFEAFTVHYQGGSQNNSQSITVINGKMTRNVSRGYVFSYQLTPRHTGTLTIPAITIEADGLTTRTRPVHVNVFKPEETDDIKLRLSLSKDHAYVGEPVTFTVTWLIRQDVRSFNFMVPLLEKENWFHFIDPEIIQKSGKKYIRIPIGDSEVIAEQGNDTYKGAPYTAISFSKILIPKQSGTFSIEPAAVTCEVLTGYRKSNRRSPFGDDFFSGVFGGRQGVYKKVVAPSNPLNLKISNVPRQGMPVHYAGHIGTYKISAQASPTKINVGDPITLTLILSGPEYLEHISLPSLNDQQNLTRDFKIPQERATGEVNGKTKMFTQTLRALRSDVNQIPSIELPYFNTETGKYKIAKTAPIPLSVKETRVITALDAEGWSLPVVNGHEVETWTQGIAYNYEDLSAISDQRGGLSLIRSPSWLASLVLPPALYLIILVTTAIIRRKQADPKAALAKKAYALLNGNLQKVIDLNSEETKSDLILDALRHYLGARLKLPHGAIVYNDVRKLLSAKGVPDTILDDLQSIFNTCEAGRYAGDSGTYDISALADKTRTIAKNLEKFFK